GCRWPWSPSPPRWRCSPPPWPRPRCYWPSCGCSGCRSCSPARLCSPCSPPRPRSSSPERAADDRPRASPAPRRRGVPAHRRRGGLALALVAAGLAGLRAGGMPAVLRRALVPGAQERRETRPVVDVAASLLAAALLTLLAYALTRPLVALDPTPITAVLPVAVAVVLIGFFVLTTRRRALSQVVGFLLLDNGITATAFLATGGIPLVVEVGVS